MAAVNAWLAEPSSKPTWTIAGACAAHDVFDLNADVVVAVDEEVVRLAEARLNATIAQVQKSQPGAFEECLALDTTPDRSLWSW